MENPELIEIIDKLIEIIDKLKEIIDILKPNSTIKTAISFSKLIKLKNSLFPNNLYPKKWNIITEFIKGVMLKEGIIE